MDDETHEIKLKSDGSCLDITDWSKDNGANIYIYTCHPHDQPQNQQVSVTNNAFLPVANYIDLVFYHRMTRLIYLILARNMICMQFINATHINSNTLLPQILLVIPDV